VRKEADLRLGETLWTERLANGLTVAVLVKPGFRSATAHLTVRYGSIDSCFVNPATGETVTVPDGIAHFLEHLLFKEEWGDVSDRFAELGAESNAHTSYNHTSYYFETTENFEPALDLLLDFVQSPHFTDELVEAEQGIIEQEILMFRDDPGWRSQSNMMEALYARHPVRIDIAGTVESIRRIESRTLQLCHSTFYHPSNMVLFAAGEIDPQQVLEAAGRSFGSRPYRPQAEIRRVLPEEPAAVAAVRRAEKLVVGQPLFRMGFKDTPAGADGRPLLERDLLTSVLLDAMAGRASRLYNSLYAEGLIDQRFGFEHTSEADYGFTYFVCPTSDPDRLEQRLQEEIASVRENGLPEADFARARRKAIGRIIASFNQVDAIAYMFTDSFLKGTSLFSMLPVADELTLAAAHERLRTHFDPQRAVVSVVVPK
jgi:predicted Zn-dependent peptidase